MAEYIDREAIFKAYMDLCRAKSQLAKANRGAAFFRSDLYPEMEPTTKEVFAMIMAMPAANVKVVEKPQTNADRIRAMSDEELAAWILWFFAEVLNANTDGDWDFSDNFRDGLLKNLRQPVKDGEDDVH